MKIRDYLSIKYRTEKPTVLTHCEAKILGVKWPLRPGWLALCGDWEITSLQSHLIQLGLAKRAARQERRPSSHAAEISRAGIAALQAAEPPVLHTQTFPSADAFLQSYEWRKVRMLALRKHGARCQCCGADASDGVKIHVDHIKPRRLFPQLALDLDNLQVLCEACNHGKGNWDITDWRPVSDSAISG